MGLSPHLPSQSISRAHVYLRSSKMHWIRVDQPTAAVFKMHTIRKVTMTPLLVRRAVQSLNAPGSCRLNETLNASPSDSLQ